ncbi:MAG: cytochrome c biogenesis protein CcsA [Chloroflexota bacterium]|nr:cytochrome c biogenesis protein CcsA [Chloroflexota bacterium]
MARTTPIEAAGAPLGAARSTGARRTWPDLAVSSLGLLTFVSMLCTLYLALLYAPTEATQGDVQRIFYFHVPVAWVGFLAFFVVFVGSGMYLWKRSLAWDAVARSSAEIGLLFTSLMLITGSLWGRPVWGTYWTWDPKLTTSLILWFIYLGYLMLRAYAPSREQSARYGAVLGIVGFVDVPIVYLATTWWRTLHPDAVLTSEGAAMPGRMVVAFLVSLLTFTLLYVYMLVQRVRVQRLQDRLDQLQMELAEGAVHG